MEINKVKRDDKITVRVSKEEKSLLYEKAKEYGYNENVSEYVRNISLHETVLVVETHGTDEVILRVDEFLIVSNNIQCILETLCKKITLSKEEIELIRQKVDQLSEDMKILIRVVKDSISFNFVKKIKS